ncbi:MAG: ArnT family glycosyltransferase [Rhizobiaceae bacterium]
MSELQPNKPDIIFNDGTDYRSLALYFIAIMLLLRCITAIALGLGIDESYTVAVARFPSLSYFDHPPLTFWLVHWTALLFGSEAPIVLRLPFLILFTASSWLLFRLTDTLFNTRAAFWAVALFSIAPFFHLSAGTWIVPDGPLIFTTLLAANIFVRIVTSEEPNESWLLWLLCGSVIGLALLSKYQAFLFGFGMFVFLLSNPRGRQILTGLPVYVAGLISFVWFLPVAIWNFDHGWQSFAFQSGRAANLDTLTMLQRITNVLVMLGGQVLYLLPGTFLLALYGLGGALKSGPSHPRRWYLLCLALSPLLIFNGLAPFTQNSLPHWPMLGYVFAFPLVGGVIDHLWRRFAGRIKWSFYVGCGFILLMQTAGLIQFNTGMLTRGITLFPSEWDQTAYNLNWFNLRDKIAKYAKPDGGNVAVFAKSWIEAGKIDYALGGTVPVLVFGADKRHFAYNRDASDYFDKKAIFVSVEEIGTGQDVAKAEILAHNVLQCELVELQYLETVTLFRGGEPHIEFVLFEGAFSPTCSK